MLALLMAWNFGAWAALIVGGPVTVAVYFAVTVAAVRIMFVA